MSPNGSLTWIEIPTTTSLSSLQSFYSTIFPTWQWREGKKEAKKPVMHFDTPDGHNGGIIQLPDTSSTPRRPEQAMGVGMTVYFQVESLDETAKLVEENGGKVVLGKTEENDFGWYMNYLDPVGNRFAGYEIRNKSA